MPGKRSVTASADDFESGHTGIYTNSAVAPHDLQDIVDDDNEGSDHPPAPLTLKRECIRPLPPPVVDASFSWTRRDAFCVELT
jgi:hypothetical protein